jgi:hypothetical protein
VLGPDLATLLRSLAVAVPIQSPLAAPGLADLLSTPSVCVHYPQPLPILLVMGVVSATGIAFLALLLSFSTHITVTLFASLAAFLAAFLTLIAFAIDIALVVYVKNQMENLAGTGLSTVAGPG